MSLWPPHRSCTELVTKSTVVGNPRASAVFVVPMATPVMSAGAVMLV
ncbi:hypothetical protein ACFY5J_23710 [Peribacillus butanolivorans]